MFELFKRVKTVVSSELHAMIDKAEDPVKMLDQFMRDMAKEISDVEKATAKIMAEQKLLNKKCEETEHTVKKREQQAIKALEANNEDLARRALADKKQMEQELHKLQNLYQETTQHVDQFKDKLKMMKAEYREMEMKKDTLKTRAQTAQAKTKVNRTFSSLNNDNAKSGFERMEQKVLRQEAEAEVSEDLNSVSQSLDDELSKMEKEDSVELELQKLKEKMYTQSKQVEE